MGHASLPNKVIKFSDNSLKPKNRAKICSKIREQVEEPIEATAISVSQSLQSVNKVLDCHTTKMTNNLPVTNLVT